MNFSDTTNFLSKLTYAKLRNAGLILYSFIKMRYRGTKVPYGFPFTLSVEPTTACNLRCPECPSGLRSFTRPTGNLKSDFFKALIDQVHEHLIYLIFYFQGEPYINPEFLEMVKYAHNKGIYTISSTNGHFLNDENARKTVESGLDRLIISIDGVTQDVYEQYRKEGNLEQVIKGTRNIVKWKKRLKSSKPHLIFQFLVVGPNEHQIEEVYALAKELGVNEVKLKSAQIYDYQDGHTLIPQQEKYSRYRKVSEGRYELKTKITDECWKMWHSAVVTWDGKVVPCCFDKNAQYVMGDLKSLPLSEIWHSEEYSDFRAKLISGRKEIDICSNCSEGCKVFF